jgi:hypothetical protein
MSVVNRRSFLAGSAAVAAGPVLAAPTVQPDFDVVIVGAGAAGVAAARRVAAAGRRFVVLEASERWGGRCFTDVRTFRVPYERGARWIYMPDLNPLAVGAVVYPFAQVYNGDIGYIEDVDSNAGEVVASFDGRSVTYGFGELDMLVPAYAATIHKSQGSEYPAVIIPVMTQHYAMLQRNLLYTGVTRGKRLVVLVGQKKAVAIAVRNASGRRRWSKLSEWLSPKAVNLEA